jgi:hypothetical protein
MRARDKTRRDETRPGRTLACRRAFPRRGGGGGAPDRQRRGPRPRRARRGRPVPARAAGAWWSRVAVVGGGRAEEGLCRRGGLLLLLERHRSLRGQRRGPGAENGAQGVIAVAICERVLKNET